MVGDVAVDTRMPTNLRAVGRASEFPQILSKDAPERPLIAITCLCVFN